MWLRKTLNWLQKPASRSFVPILCCSSDVPSAVLDSVGCSYLSPRLLRVRPSYIHLGEGVSVCLVPGGSLDSPPRLLIFTSSIVISLTTHFWNERVWGTEQWFMVVYIQVLNKSNTGTVEVLLLPVWVHLRLEADYSWITHSRRSPHGTAISFILSCLVCFNGGGYGQGGDQLFSEEPSNSLRVNGLELQQGKFWPGSCSGHWKLQ